jgi:rubrerythrin
MDNSLYYLAKKEELKGNWEEAYKLWKMIGSKEDANAVKMIIDANAAGDEFRRLNEICPVCNIVSLKESETCPNCKVIKAKVKKNPLSE